MASAPFRLRALPALLALLLHGLAAVFVLRAMAQGFPVGHLRFWSNTVIPALVAVGCLVGLVGFRRPERGSGVLWGLAGVWVGGGVVASLFFPRSLPLAWLGGVGVAVLLAGLARLAGRLSGGRVAFLLFVGLVPGAVVSLAQRAPPSSTHPSNADIPYIDSGWLGRSPTWKNSDGRVSTFLEEGRVRVECGGLVLQVYPLMTFVSRSPDRAWSNLAPAKTNEVPRQLTGLQWTALTLQAVFQDDGVTTLQLTDLGQELNLVSFSLLRKSVFSHLNSYLAFEVEGQPKLALEFSPMPGKPVEILPSEYPTGLPARAAYLTQDHTLRVIEANSGEKGPFRTLQEAKLEGEGALTLTLHDAQGPACRIEVLDWASQASTELSPSAGWGLPQNAIAFHRTRTDPTAPAEVVLTLASTSLGRGWDTVGHAAGSYRSRVNIRSLREEPGSPHGSGTELAPEEEGPLMLPHHQGPAVPPPDDSGGTAAPH